MCFLSDNLKCLSVPSLDLRFRTGFPLGNIHPGKLGANNKQFVPAWQQEFAVLVISLAKVFKK